MPRKKQHLNRFQQEKTHRSDKHIQPFLSKNYFVDSNVPSSNIVTLPETNSKFAPENGGLEYKPILLGPGLREGTSQLIQNPSSSAARPSWGSGDTSFLVAKKNAGEG